MNDLVQELIDRIDLAQEIETYQSIIKDGIIKLNNHGYSDIAAQISQLSQFQKNRFSETETKENFNNNKVKVKEYLQLSVMDNQYCKISEGEAVIIVESILKNFKQSLDKMFHKNIHGKCNDTLKNHLPNIGIQNEYDVQHLMYPFLLSVFEDCRMEKCQDTGHHTVREDIVIDSYKIIIELKCTRRSMTERDLSEEVAADILHYKERHLFFYIYDKEKIIANNRCFINTYEGMRVEGKDIHVIIAN